MHPFEKILSVSPEDLDLRLSNYPYIEFADFWLNPRRLRGSDFLMRWSQGLWSEERLTQAVNDTETYIAIPYGPSSVAPDNVRAFELYFERLESAGLGQIKRPDLLLFNKSDQTFVENTVRSLGGLSELPFTSEEVPELRSLINKALVAVECENSLWQAKMMPDYGKPLTPQKRLDGKLGLKKTAVLPTIIIKEEDRAPLRRWQETNKIPIHIWHHFFDLAFGISYDRAEQLLTDGLILPREQTFQAPSGATTTKIIYNFYYHYSYPLSEEVESPTLVADYITDKNGHILPYVRFVGGTMKLTSEALAVLQQLKNA